MSHEIRPRSLTDLSVWLEKNRGDRPVLSEVEGPVAPIRMLPACGET